MQFGFLTTVIKYRYPIIIGAVVLAFVLGAVF